MAVILPVARQQYTDGNGFPLVGGSVAFCQPNTSGTVFRPIYADEAETIPLSNPCPLDSAGITFSGGSQVSVWGFGAYELFVRDADRNLIYSAVIDTPAGLTGGTIQGSVQINGDLSVTGNITDTQSLTSPQINGTNADFAGSVSANSVGAVNAGFDNLGVNDSATIDGNLSVIGTSNLQGLVTAGGIQTGPIVATTVDAAEFLVSGAPLQFTQGGQAATDGTGHVRVSFPTPFPNIVQAVVCTITGAVLNDSVTMSVGAWDVTGFDMYSFFQSIGDLGPIGFGWIAVGS
jgi:hypothetical protein